MATQNKASLSAANIGKRATVKLGEIHFEVKITDVRQAFGRTDYQLEPAAGTGRSWVSSENVTIIKEKPKTKETCKEDNTAA